MKRTNFAKLDTDQKTVSCCASFMGEDLPVHYLGRNQKALLAPALLVFVTVTAARCYAQFNSDIERTVTDPIGAAVPKPVRQRKHSGQERLPRRYKPQLDICSCRRHVVGGNLRGKFACAGPQLFIINGQY
jgi:hypothetical protein